MNPPRSSCSNEKQLSDFLDGGIITGDTYDWMKPLHEKEQADRREILLAAEARRNDPFYFDRDEEEDEDILFTTTTQTLRNIEGTPGSLSFAADDNSTGHGNKVWHSSIATCRYLKEEFLANSPKTNWWFGTNSSKPLATNTTPPNSGFRSLELGAGTALPSLFLASQLKQWQRQRQRQLEAETAESAAARSAPPATVCISDAKQYRNIHQILRSVGMQLDSDDENSDNSDGSNPHSDDNVRFEVHPHNWGDLCDKVFSSCSGEDIGVGYDLVIASDCLYNPQYQGVLLESIVHALAIDGRAVVSFSLHGNVGDEAIWAFVEQAVPAATKTMSANAKANAKASPDASGGKEAVEQSWRLRARCVSAAVPNGDDAAGRGNRGREGWDMEETMRELDMPTEGLAKERWKSYVYELTWVPLRS